MSLINPSVRCRLLLSACLALTSLHVFADELGLSKKYDACMDGAGGVTASMLDCIGAEADRQDKRLNKAYKALMAAQTPERKKQLLEVQRLWLKYRETNCSFYADPDGGTAAQLAANGCFLDTTARRAKELESLK